MLRSSNVKNGEIVDADNVYVSDKVATSENVQEGDIIVVVRNGSRALIGKHAQIKASMPNTVIGAFMSGIRSEYSSFVNALLDTSAFENEVAKNMGATINQITGYMFSKMEFMIPSEEEQQKIGEYFSNLDNLITLHQRKQSCNTLFINVWEQRKLSEVAEIVGGGTPSTNIPEYWDGDIDWYAPAEINDQIYVDGSERKITKLGLEKSSAKILPADKTVLFTSRAGIGKTSILRRSGATNQGFQSMVLNNETNPYFVFSMSKFIKEEAERVASGSTFAEVSGKILGNLAFMFPTKKEQDKIGEYFSNLDNLITLHRRAYHYTKRRTYK